jgi:hypothetical protein
LIWEKNTRK